VLSRGVSVEGIKVEKIRMDREGNCERGSLQMKIYH